MEFEHLGVQSCNISRFNSIMWISWTKKVKRVWPEFCLVTILRFQNSHFTIKFSKFHFLPLTLVGLVHQIGLMHQPDLPPLSLKKRRANTSNNLPPLSWRTRRDMSEYLLFLYSIKKVLTIFFLLYIVFFLIIIMFYYFNKISTINLNFIKNSFTDLKNRSREK